jgi:trimethylamine--corrinoid protein Co-methyltransferase
MLKNTEKGMTWVYNTGAEHEVSDLVKLWEIAAGGAEELRKRPHVLGHVIINPPRVVDVNYTDWLIGFCGAGIPVTVYSALMGGATGPATLAGMLVQALAETLALVVQVQSYKPGHPLCFCSFNPSMDMRTGLWSFGNPEYGTVGAGIAAMAKTYGVPCVGFTINDACDTDEQAAYESALKNYTYALSGMSLMWDIGGMAGFNFVDWAHMCIDNEVVSLIGHYLKGIRVDEERMAVDEILKVGPLPGSYLKEPYTRKWYKEEFLIPELSNRDFFETWERGHTELLEKAKQKALKILETHQSPVAPEIRKEIDDYLDFVKKRDVGESDRGPTR